MKINRNNYELFFVDYLDGNLSDYEIRMLENFLLINPDLRAELEGTEKISLSPETVVFNQKDLLRKPDISLPVNENNLEDFCIAVSEGDLNEQQHKGLDNYLKSHPESESLLALYRQLHLTPDRNIIYPWKGKLKKTIMLIPREVLYPLLSVAAAVTLMMIIYLRSEDITQNLPGIASDLPSAIIAKPDPTENEPILEKEEIQRNVPEISQAAIITFSAPKEKKKTPEIKKNIVPERTNSDQKGKDLLPPQKLNPSFEIKLPSVAENQINIPSIEGDRISYSTVKTKQKSPEYLSISEYARQQLSEKVLGSRERITAWEIADVGISGINKLTGGEMKLEKKTDEEGKIAAYSFDSRLLSFSTTSVNKR